MSVSQSARASVSTSASVSGSWDACGCGHDGQADELDLEEKMSFFKEWMSDEEFRKKAYEELKKDLTVTHFAEALRCSTIDEGYQQFLAIPHLCSLLPRKYKVEKRLTTEKDILLYLHPCRTPNGIFLCPHRVFELLLIIYEYRYKHVPETINLQTMLDATVLNLGASTKVFTPVWLTILPDGMQMTTDLREIRKKGIKDYALVGIYEAGDDKHSIERNCG